MFSRGIGNLPSAADPDAPGGFIRLIDPPLICRLSIAGKHLLRIRKAAGSHWNEEPYLSIRLAWRERYRHPRMIMFWHKVFKDLPRSFTR